MAKTSQQSIKLKLSKGTFIAEPFNTNGYAGINIRFPDAQDNLEEPEVPSVSFELDRNGDLHVLVYDKTGDEPAFEIGFVDGRAVERKGEL